MKMKSRKKVVDPWCVERYKEMLDILWNAKDTLMAKTENVICKKGVVDLYPEGADKAFAQAEYEDAQHKLICAIGNYDARKQEAEEFYKKHYEELYGYTNKFATSHFIVEFVYKHFFKK
jgi:hypothetical protein